VAGDRTEVETLTRFFESAGAAPSSCALGSVKSMIGHTKCAAGLAGMLKVALALYHRVVAATINVDRPNPSLFSPSNPIYVNTETRPWLASSDHPRRAGVNSFGFGGTNFTAILEEYDGDPAAEQRAATPDWPGELLIWRADDPACLAVDLAELSDLPAAGAKPALRDLAALLWRTAQERSGRTLAIVAASLDDLALKLKAAHACIGKAASAPPLAGIYFFGQDEPAALGKVAFLFPGKGSQSVNMLTDLALHFSEVRGGFERAQSVLAGQLPELGRSVFPPPAFTAAEHQAQTAALTRTAVAQPALGAASMGVLHLLAGLGVRPDMAAGHSYGEIAALCCAGMFDGNPLPAVCGARTCRARRHHRRTRNDGRDQGGPFRPRTAVARPTSEADEAIMDRLYALGYMERLGTAQ
jgi:acyl transferase domain-containing protein